jgi:isopentenyl diphosphate isomerase/L-lactate dehydrogenase-like FMN-dependent dehydrogenase
MSLASLASIDDLRLCAKKRLPKFAFDFIDGGADDELNLRKNRTAFDEIELIPRYLNNIEHRSLSVRLFGDDYAVPFGIAPVGFMNSAWPGADLMLARLAGERRLPYSISTASSTALEPLTEAADGCAWFQLYYPCNANVYGGLIERAIAAGIKVMMLTVDVSSPGKRDRDIRNQLAVPFKLTPRVIADLCRHPRWALATARSGSPNLANILPYVDDGSRSLAKMQAELISSTLNWEILQRIRDDWPGKLLIKGILHPDDASRAIKAGCDGIVVSNHGGRQISFGPASISALPAIAKAAGDAPVLLDSGIRRGADIVRAKALGASMVLAGRAFAYGAGAADEAGVKKVYDILHTELDRAVGQIGCTDFNDIDDRFLR